MISPFFVQAAVSPGRQRSFRSLVAAHLALLAGGAWLVLNNPATGAALLGHALLIAGIVEGALLIGWRLTQLPRSLALEFLLASPVRPWQLFLAEAGVGLTRLALVTLAGLPVLLLLVLEGRLLPADVAPLLLVPFTWGAVAGLTLVVWAYEPVAVRACGEKVLLALVIFYLVVGVLAGEHLREWLAWLPDELAGATFVTFEAVHRYSPFAVLQRALTQDPSGAAGQVLVLEAVAAGLAVLLLVRAACRLKGHFDDRHYRPVVDTSGARRGYLGEKPLRWWAVRRVSEYAGRVNLHLAGGFGVVYALYTLAGPFWPGWLGRQVFQIFDALGGIPVVATGLIVLAAVPAAFQYGLWDSNTQDRCRRLELLLLTRLNANDYWEAAAAAAWQRGAGYFAVAALLLLSALIAGQLTAAQTLAVLAAGVVLWGLYFALGFRAFARGVQANTGGLLLTLGLPVLACGLYQAGWPVLASLVPPGGVYFPSTGEPAALWLVGPLLSGGVMLGLSRYAQTRCVQDLRQWYDRHHGQKVID